MSETRGPVPKELMQRRYGESFAGTTVTSPVIESLLDHRSVRGFLDIPLLDGVLETVIAAAQSASTSSNLQAWSVVAVQSLDQRKALASLISRPDLVETSAAFLMWIADLSRLYTMANRHERPTEGMDFFEGTLVATIDTAIAAQNAAAAAESLGLGIVYVGAMRNKPLEVAEILALPKHAICLFGMAIGVPDPAMASSPKPRLPMSSILHRERYNTTAFEGDLERYERAIGDFYLTQNIAREAWSHYSTKRVSTAASIHGRDKLKGIFRQLGFLMK